MLCRGLVVLVLVAAAGVLAFGAARSLAWLERPEANGHPKQPVAFPHNKHLAYLQSGKHREAMIQMHLKIIDEEEPPEELAQGKCYECHGLDDQPQCAGCHMIFQKDEVLKGRKDIRACIGCHRKAWSAMKATIPSIKVCRSCHEKEAITSSPEEAVLREHIARGQDLRWVRVGTMPWNVQPSHQAHVRFAGLSCETCHGDLTETVESPRKVRFSTMSSCFDCHRKTGGSLDCLACHN